MKKLMGQDGVILDVSVWDKSRLKRGNDLREENFQTVSKYFGYDLVCNIA
jgi:hypothetical protein